MGAQLAYSPAEAAKLGGISMSKLYEEVRKERLTIRKLGRRSLIAHEDLRAWLNGLPKKAIPCARSEPFNTCCKVETPQRMRRAAFPN